MLVNGADWISKSLSGSKPGMIRWYFYSHLLEQSSAGGEHGMRYHSPAWAAPQHRVPADGCAQRDLQPPQQRGKDDALSKST